MVGNRSIEKLRIGSPKRNRHLQTGWEGFFPYYAGFPEKFSRELIESASLPAGSLVLDPWNGSGTTTYTASQLGFNAIGVDLNPVMVVVARARLLSHSEADSIEPLAQEVVQCARNSRKSCSSSDALNVWLDSESATMIRAIERSIRKHLVGRMTVTKSGTKLDRISGIAATFYVALFAVCREMVAPYQSSNPTWLRQPKQHERKIQVPANIVTARFIENLTNMAAVLEMKANRPELIRAEYGACDIRLADSASFSAPVNSIDLILTSPPYCTRIDYTAATRIELAVLEPLLVSTPAELSRQMIGSTRVPSTSINPSPLWGPTCHAFLSNLVRHPSKASSGYYLRTHLDYFNKMSRSISNLTLALKPNGIIVLVVQDSYYKDIHNNLPVIVGEMGENHGLRLVRSEQFRLRHSMAGINPHTRLYSRASGATESVLCFTKTMPYGTG